jgi:hypothetical protein
MLDLHADMPGRIWAVTLNILIEVPSSSHQSLRTNGHTRFTPIRD